jgi:hypothetical protein
MRRPTVEQWDGLCDELVVTARRLQAEGPGLLRRAKEPIRDGFPTSSLGRGRPSSVIDDEGIPMPPLNDPVGELAVDLAVGRVHDPTARTVDEMVSQTVEALRLLRGADGARARCLPPEEPPPGPAAPAGCVVHARYGLVAPVRAAGRCRWCGDYRKSHGFADPPESAVRALEDGRVAREQRWAA